MSETQAVLLGVPIDGYTMAGALDHIADLVLAGRREGRCYRVATVNVDFLVNALDDPVVLRILQDNDVNLADGMPLVWASRFLGPTLPERVAGADLVPHLAQLSAERGVRIHLFGAAPGVAERARAEMLSKHPTALVTSDGGPANIDPSILQDEIVESIGRLSPDILCVALGNPKQELFIDTYRGRLDCPVMIGIGGSLDMLVGDKKRAPDWLQRIGGEWVFRAAQEPRRLGRRYGRDLRVFGPRLVSHVRATRKFRNGAHLGARVDREGELIVERSVEEDREFGTQDLATSGCVDVRLHGIDALHPDSHARLIGLIRRARTAQVPLSMSGASSSLLRCFDTYGTAELVAGSIAET